MCDCVSTERSVQTCPECLPVGAITWLIENGRQLDMFEPRPPEPVRVPGVLAFNERDDPDGPSDPNQVKPVSSPGDGLPF